MSKNMDAQGLIRESAKAARRQYEAEFTEAFGYSPTEAAHLEAYWRRAYQGLMAELIQRLNIPRMSEDEAKKADFGEAAPYLDAYPQSAHVLKYVREPLMLTLPVGQKASPGTSVAQEADSSQLAKERQDLLSALVSGLDDEQMDHSETTHQA